MRHKTYQTKALEKVKSVPMVSMMHYQAQARAGES